MEQIIHPNRAVAALAARQVTDRAFDERDEHRVQRQVAGQVVEPRCENQNPALAEPLLEQQRRPVLQSNRNARIALIERYRIEKPHALPFLGRACSRKRRVGLADSGKALRFPRVMLQALDSLSQHRDLRLLRGCGAQRHEHVATGANVLLQTICESGGQRCHVAQHDECVLSGIGAPDLVHSHLVQSCRALRG